MGWQCKAVDRARGKAPIAVEYSANVVEGGERSWDSEPIVVTAAEAKAAGLEYGKPTATCHGLSWDYSVPVTINEAGSHLVVARLPKWVEGRKQTIIKVWYIQHDGSVEPWKPGGHKLGYGLCKVLALKKAEANDLKAELDIADEPDFVLYSEACFQTEDMSTDYGVSGSVSCALIAA